MPPGYTADVADGTVTSFPQFAMSCARAFGALADLRDDPAAPIPDEFGAPAFYREALTVAERHLDRLQRMHPADAQAEMQREFSREQARHVDAVLRVAETAARYALMQVNVAFWRPPTPDHQNLRDFMRDQLKQSVDFDCDLTYYRDHTPKLQRWETWLAQQIKAARSGVDLRRQQLAEQEARAEDRTAWVRALRQSLKGF